MTAVQGEMRRIEDLEAARAYINQIDFGPLKAKLTSPHSDGGFGWSVARADYFEDLYKKWLFLVCKHPGESLPPHEGIDEFWHAHILDTRAYIADCDRLFGTYLHHFPYFGTRGEQDHADLMDAWQNTQNRFRQEYGDWIYDFEGPE